MTEKKKREKDHRGRTEKALEETIKDRDSCKKRAKKLARKTKELTEEVEAKDEMAKLVEKDRWGIQAKAIVPKLRKLSCSGAVASDFPSIATFHHMSSTAQDGMRTGMLTGEAA